ncbi:MAG: DNA-directed RNA polymerase I subunit rpa49 [Lichina confinis]|nr:MAG: DNA-directed RNA polymerase I subunit rpa49 [Lichina confinis]
MTDLKRKRKSQGSEHNSKRLATDGSLSIARFSVNPVQEGAEPVVVSAPGIVIPASIPFKAYKKSIKRQNVVPRVGNRPSGATKSELLLHSSAHASIDYTAREEEFKNTDGLLKHYVGVYDPDTGGVDVVEIRKMVMRGAVRAENPESDVEVADEAPRSFQVRRQELGEAFGNRKTKKAIASKQENAIIRGETGDSSTPSKGRGRPDLARTVLLESLEAATAGTATREEMQAELDKTKPRPNPNQAAKTVEGVYPLDEVVGGETMQVLSVHDWLDAAATQRPMTIGSQFVSRRLLRLAPRAISERRSGEDAGAVARLKALRYILLLLNVVGAAKSKGGKNTAKALPERDELRRVTGVSDFLLETVKRSFTDRGSLTKWHIDKLITYVAALTLIIDDYEVDTYDIQEDLRLDDKQITKYYRELGCKVTVPTKAQRDKYHMTSNAEAAQRRIARLSLPLQFPQSKIGAFVAGKRKRR